MEAASAWIMPGIIVLSSICYLSTFVYIAIGKTLKQRHHYLWALAWLFFGTRYVFDILSFRSSSLIWFILKDIMVCFSALYLIKGYLYLIKDNNKWKLLGLRLALFIATFWTIFFQVVVPIPKIASMPVYIITGLLTIIMGWSIYKSNHNLIHIKSSKGLGLALILWALHRLNYPFFSNNIAIAPYGYLLAAILTATVSLFLFELTVETETYEKDSSITRYRLLFENARDVIMLTSQTDQIIEVNRAAEKTYGYRKEELIGKNLAIIRDPSTNTDNDYYFSSHLYQTVHQRKNGSTFPVEISVQVMNLGNDEVQIVAIRDISERKADEEKVKKSQEFYLSLFEQLPMPMWRASSTGQFDYFNKSWLHFTGKTSEEEAGLNWTEGIHRDYKDAFMQAYLKAIWRKEPFTITYRFRRQDGEFRWVINVGRPFTDLDGNYAGFIGTFFDVTNEIESREEIRELKERLSITLRSINDAVIATDMDGFITLFNREAENLIGIKESEALGCHFTDKLVLCDESKTNCSIDLLQSIRQGVKYNKKELFLSVNEEKTIPVAHSANLIRKEDGVVEGMVLVLRDITQEKEAEKKLRDSEARYRTTFENNGTALLIANNDGVIELVNREMEVLTSFSKEEIEGKMSWKDFVAPKDLDRMLGYNRQRFSSLGTPPKLYEFTILDRYGKERAVFCSVELLPGEKKIVASWVDLTERKRAEEKIIYLSYHDHLTGLYNRAKFDQELERLNQPENLPLSIIIGDLNGLKLVNDAFGHEKGDELLKNIAQILQSSTRDTDIVARCGGDEFIILLPKTSFEEASSILEGIKETCATTESTSDLDVYVSISLGLGTKTHPEENVQDIINQAESDMYSQKIDDASEYKAKVLSSLEARLLDRNKETKSHVLRVKKISRKIGKAIGLTKTQLDELTIAAALHDIGKVGIDEHLWVKAENLEEDALEKIKQHPIIGYHIIKTYPQLSGVAEAVLSHHERWDGKGFPKGLKKTEIPIMARIIAIADAFDAMTNTKKPVLYQDTDKVLKELTKGKGTEFDPELVDAFLETFDAKSQN